MRLLVLGGTGPAGLQLVREALSAAHTLVIYARSPQKLPDTVTSHNSVTIIQGELTDADKLFEALDGVQAVLSALGPPVKSGPLYPSGNPLAHAYALVIDAMKKRGVRRLIALGTPSMKDEHDKFSVEFALLVSGVAVFAHNAYTDVVAIGETIRSHADELEWTIARVPLLDGREKRDVVAGYIGDGKTGTRLSRAAFAAFVIGEVEANEWRGKAPLICSP